MTAVGIALASKSERERYKEWERERSHVCGVCGTLFLETCAHCHFEQCSSRSRWGNLSRSHFLTISLFSSLSLSLSLPPRIRQAFAVGLGTGYEAVLSWVGLCLGLVLGLERLVSASQSITQFDFAINSCLFEWTHGLTHSPFCLFLLDRTLTKALEIGGDSIGLQKQLSA